MKLTIRPLTPEVWPALEDLFGKRGAANGCWCMYGRIGSAYRKRPAEKNKSEFRDIVKRGPSPGLLAFDGDLAVGWCQVTPRDAVPALDRVWRLKRVDDTPVWILHLRADWLSEAWGHLPADRACSQSRKASQGTCARSLSVRCGSIA